MNDLDYEEWEKQVEKAKKHNKKILDEFEEYLNRKSLTQKTIKNHILNIDFFANGYLLRYEIIPIEKGALEIGSFLGDFFIRKAMWASKTSIKENIASFNKFYTFLSLLGKISKEELDMMKKIIKYEKEEWLEDVDGPGYMEDDW